MLTTGPAVEGTLEAGSPSLSPAEGGKCCLRPQTAVQRGQTCTSPPPPLPAGEGMACGHHTPTSGGRGQCNRCAGVLYAPELRAAQDAAAPFSRLFPRRGSLRRCPGLSGGSPAYRAHGPRPGALQTAGPRFFLPVRGPGKLWRGGCHTATPPHPGQEPPPFPSLLLTPTNSPREVGLLEIKSLRRNHAPPLRLGGTCALKREDGDGNGEKSGRQTKPVITHPSLIRRRVEGRSCGGSGNGAAALETGEPGALEEHNTE